MKREKIFKKACKGGGIQIINNTYTDENGEIHTRNQWVSVGGGAAAFVIDFPRALNENEILSYAGVQSEKFCEGFVRFVDSSEIGIDLSDNFKDSDILLDRCDFTINGKYTLFKSANGAPIDTSFLFSAENLSFIDGEKDLEFYLRNCNSENPCVIAKTGLVAIAVFLPLKFTDGGKLADNAFRAYKIISQN